MWLSSCSLCHQEVNVFLSPLHVSYHTCSTWFFASEICRGCWQSSGLCAVVVLRGVSCFPVTCRRESVLLLESKVASGSKDCPGPPWLCPALQILCDLDEWQGRKSIAWLMSFPFPPLSLIFKACCSNPMPSFYRSHNPFRPQKIPSDWDSLDNQLYSLSSFMQYWQQWQLREVTRRLLVL